MSTSSFGSGLRAGAFSLVAIFLPIVASAEPVKPVAQQTSSAISLDAHEPRQPDAVSKTGRVPIADPRANVYTLAATKAGGTPLPERITLRFSGSTQLTEIRSKSPKEFHIEDGGSCSEGSFYRAGDSCELVVRFTPQGAGHRLGKVTIAHTASEKPFPLNIIGESQLPVVSFTPAVISTVTSTYPGSKGLLADAQSLATDDSDNLYVADTGSNLIRYIDSSGALTTIASGLVLPSGIAADSIGNVYFDEPDQQALLELDDYGNVSQIDGSGSHACTYPSSSSLAQERISYPAALSVTPGDDVFVKDGFLGAGFFSGQQASPTYTRLYDVYTSFESDTGSFAVDSAENLYSYISDGACQIVVQPLIDAEEDYDTLSKIAGGRTCGFSGDGGQAGSAEISGIMGQLYFDLANNLYFVDAGNQRVRRVDHTTGIISTIAGNGTAGFSGDGGAATLATLSNPTGLAVDSQGQVYIISSTTVGGTAQVVRKLGPNGYLSLGSQVKGVAGAAQTFTIANTGNSTLSISNHGFTGANPGDFAIDPLTTNCVLTAGSTLAVGQSCKVGIKFTPGAASRRTANLVFVDNTVASSNTVQLAGVGTLPAPTFTVTAPAAGSSVSSGTAVKFAVSVTSASGTAPTGTVTFKVDTTSLGTVTLSSGAASVSTSQTTTGTHTLSATYNGDANYAAAGPITRTYTVTAAAKVPATVKLTTSANPATKCKPPVISVSVKDSAMPTGKVELRKGSTVLATATLKNGAATFSTSGLAVGTSSLTAKYLGDSGHSESSSKTLAQKVKSASACTAKK